MTLLPLVLLLLAAPGIAAARAQEPDPAPILPPHAVPAPGAADAPVLLVAVPPGSLPETPDPVRDYLTDTGLDAWTIVADDPREPRAVGALLDAIEAAFRPEGDGVHLVGPATVLTAAAEHRDRLASLVLLLRDATPLPPGAPESLAGLPVAVLVAGEPGAPPAGLDALVADLRARGAEPVRALFRPLGADRLPDLADPALARELDGFRRRARERARRTAVDRVLDDFHAAAAEPDGARYFAHFAPGAVFLGTDATERWSVADFRAYAEPHFSQGRGWLYTPTERHVAFGPSGDVAWFDERLHNDKYGETRGSGVLVRRGERWRIAQYVLSIPVPNELAPEVVERIRALDK